MRRLERLMGALDSRAREYERRIAAFLHDTPLQLLSSAALRVSMAPLRTNQEERAEELECAQRLLRQGVREVRRATQELRQHGGASDDDTQQVLRALANRAEDLLGVVVDLEIESRACPSDPALTPVLGEAIRVLLFEIALQGGSRGLLRYADCPGGDLVISLSAAELEGDDDAVERLLREPRSSLATYDVEMARVGPSVRFVVPAALVEDRGLRPAPARSHSG